MRKPEIFLGLALVATEALGQSPRPQEPPNAGTVFAVTSQVRERTRLTTETTANTPPPEKLSVPPVVLQQAKELREEAQKKGIAQEKCVYCPEDSIYRELIFESLDPALSAPPYTYTERTLQVDKYTIRSRDDIEGQVEIVNPPYTITIYFGGYDDGEIYIATSPSDYTLCDITPRSGESSQCNPEIERTISGALEAVKSSRKKEDC